MLKILKIGWGGRVLRPTAHLGLSATSTRIGIRLSSVYEMPEPLKQEDSGQRAYNSLMRSLNISRHAPFLSSLKTNPDINELKPPALPWYFSKVFLIVMLLSVGPFALPWIWFHPTLSKKWKWGITLITVALTYLLCVLTLMAIRQLKETLQLLYSLNP
jgi:hypothetical protein